MQKRDSSPPSGLRVIRFKELQSRVGYSRMHIFRLEREGMFPKRIKIGANSVGWIESEINDWLRSKIDQREAAAMVDVAAGA